MILDAKLCSSFKILRDDYEYSCVLFEHKEDVERLLK